MRAFLAVELPSSVRHALAQLQDRLRASRADVKWVEPQNLHLTVRFLGEIDDAQRSLIEAVAQTTAARIGPVTAGFGALGAFPSASSPRVVWVGLEQGAEALERLAAQVESQLVQAGWPGAEKPFSAHITLGRVRSPRGRSELVRALREVSWTPPASFVVDHLTLFRSDLSSSGPRYSVVSTFRFCGA